MSKPRHALPSHMLPGHFQATMQAAKTIRRLEEEVTAWFAGHDVSVFDIVDMALSLSGLTITAGMDDNIAAIQSSDQW
jgi:hypothetical protein